MSVHLNIGLHSSTAADSRFCELKPEGRRATVRIVADRLANQESVRTLFAQHGFEYVNGTLVPLLYSINARPDIFLRPRPQNSPRQ
jgi:hypothetical protein